MNAESTSIRTPKPAYNGRNGFVRGYTEQEQVQGDLEAAIRAHERALFFIDHKQRNAPDSLKTMKEEVAKPADLEYLSQQISSLKQNHTKDLERFYAMKAAEYEDEVKERYRSTDMGGVIERDLIVNEEIAKDYVMHADWNSHLEQMQYAYLSQLLPLQKEHRDYRARQEHLRQMQLKMFPQSKEDFDTKTPEMQLRVARFLAAEEKQKEILISKFNWAWRQTSPLIEEFKKDSVFAARIRGMVLAEMNVSDPRRPRPAP